MLRERSDECRTDGGVHRNGRDLLGYFTRRIELKRVSRAMANNSAGGYFNAPKTGMRLHKQLAYLAVGGHPTECLAFLSEEIRHRVRRAVGGRPVVASSALPSKAGRK
jgi:hypothetical protein